MNGKAEQYVETFKLGINKTDPKTAIQLENDVIDFLVKYKTIPNILTRLISIILLSMWLRTVLACYLSLMLFLAGSEQQPCIMLLFFVAQIITLTSHYDYHPVTDGGGVW